MTTLEQASKKIVEIINKYRQKLDEKYLKIELSSDTSGVFLTCFMQNGEKITLKARKDYDRTIFTPPKSSKEYQNQGGHKALSEKIQRINLDAWKIEVKRTIKNQIMEIGFSGSESHWSAEQFELDFKRTILD